MTKKHLLVLMCVLDAIFLWFAIRCTLPIVLSAPVWGWQKSYAEAFINAYAALALTFVQVAVAVLLVRRYGDARPATVKWAITLSITWAFIVAIVCGIG